MILFSITDPFSPPSYELLNDDRPHSIQLLLLGRNLTMQVDGGLSRSVINDGARDRLRAPRALYVGGVPESVGETALGLWHLRNSTSLRGEQSLLMSSLSSLSSVQAAS